MAFTRRLTITPQTGKVPSTQTNYPILVKVTHNDLRTIANGGYMENASGFDFRSFSDAGLTAGRNYELIAYDGSAGTIYVWTNVASLAVGAPYYFGFGDASLNTDGSSTSTWPTDFKQVIHGGDGSTPSVADSSQSGNNGTAHSMSAVAGIIRGALGFDGSSGYISMPNIGISGDAARTISFWVYPTTTSGSRYAFTAGSDSTPGHIFAIRINASGVENTLYLYTSGGDRYNGGGITQNAWNHIVCAYAGGGLTDANTDFYINGVNSGSLGLIGSAAAINTDNTTWEWGRVDGVANLQGRGEELRIRNLHPGDAYAAIEYNSQINPATFASYAFDAPGAGGGASGLLRSSLLNGLGNGGRFFGNPLG